MKKTVSWISLLILAFVSHTITAQDYANMSVKKEDIPIREIKRNAITGNIGWNGLTGFGITYNNYLLKQLELDLGLGLASTGFKVGGRLSYLFMDKNFSPFVSGGFTYGMGTGDSEIDYDYNNNQFSYTIDSSPFLQICGGVEYMSNGGFLIRGNLGYAILLKETNYQITQGVPTNDELKGLDTALGSGIVIEFSIGYAFGGSK